MLNRLKSLLTHPLVRRRDVDAPDISTLHLSIIREKPFLQRIYKQWYDEISKSLPLDVNGPVLELGSGAGFLKDFIPDLIASDILEAPKVDIRLDAQFLPFKKASFRGIVMTDVFHHIPNVRLFLAEAADCLQPGGAIIMIEPWRTKWSEIVYRYLHHEPFESNVKNWDFPKGGPLSQANGALPWIVFERDSMIFERDFSKLFIKEINIHTPFRYLLSGGVSLRFSAPEGLHAILHRIEKCMGTWLRFCGMFATVILERS